MDSMLEAAIWFWIPLCLVPVGMWFSVSGKAKTAGKLIPGIGFVLVMISSWTVPSSDSTAGGHLLLSIVAPSLLLAYGVHGMSFGGNVPGGRLDSSARWRGSLAICISLLIFCLMHWYSFTPLWRNEEINPYWIVFWPTFLLFSTSLCSVSAVALASYGENRLNESINLAILSVTMAGIALAAMIFDGYMATSNEFRDYLWLAAADIFGTIVGISLAIAAFAIVIWAYENSLPLPENSPPPTEDEIEHVVALAKNHIGGDEE
ncbi:MAG: hypothetical protein MK197_06820 [Candidatus Poseidoniaceae archaeon]|nr:hypothetical protein [Candidatus Poseidoniaceae archaeon]